MAHDSHATHPAEAGLHAFLDGELGPDELRLLERHLASCPACARRLARAQDLFARIEALPDQAVAHDLSRPVVRSLRGRPRPLPVLGLLGLQSLAAVGLLWVAGERALRMLAPLARIDLPGTVEAGWVSFVGALATLRPPVSGLQFGLAPWLREIRPGLLDLGVPVNWALWGLLALVTWLLVNSLVLRAERERPGNGR